VKPEPFGNGVDGFAPHALQILSLRAQCLARRGPQFKWHPLDRHGLSLRRLIEHELGEVTIRTDIIGIELDGRVQFTVLASRFLGDP
jgi:hypothetical protein